jgi:hypothetical protein
VEIVPSDGLENGESALAALLAGAISLRAAVAFATVGGVDLLASALSGHPGLDQVEVVARGAPVTEREALLKLRDDLGASVSVLAGSTFHPKLWLAPQSDGSLMALSGSGNLTVGGMRKNREQFDLARFEDSGEMAAQLSRFEALTRDAIPLERFENSIAWRTWEAQDRKRRRLEDQLRDLNQEIESAPPESREADKELLMRELWRIHNEAKAAELPKEDGGVYDPSGFRLELEGHRGNGQPVSIVKRLCESETSGFRTLVGNGRPDLTVEWLIAYSDAAYVTLIAPEVRETAKERLESSGREGPDGAA